ncbi:hypothetical protein L227DRAFT_579740 [Lentinus tigrinus ALCF2SS1-6]|uniref:Uncharacterized protein n=1 Tax=Lentinus tigrinus ALCF2SS1-6 TaxID=1328759 RepID=A0A5C2RVF9_9APHY|nr:hypothetical protein L227DRAFT_579740 [Lentinus tigrinus ALCF2SS1-6]
MPAFPPRPEQLSATVSAALKLPLSGHYERASDINDSVSSRGLSPVTASPLSQCEGWCPGTEPAAQQVFLVTPKAS